MEKNNWKQFYPKLSTPDFPQLFVPKLTLFSYLNFDFFSPFSGSYVNIADLEPEEHKKDNFKLLPSHLEKWEEKFGKFANHSILLINFHWAQHKAKDSDVKEFPSISAEAAEWIANSKKFVGIGIDTLHVDIDNTVTSPALHALHGSNIYILEKLNFEKITENLKHFYVVAVPLKNDVNDAAPVRVIAV